MKRKSDFVTNSSSTSFVVVDTWEIDRGAMMISQDLDMGLEVFDITKIFMAYIYKLTNNEILLDFGIEKHGNHLQLGFESLRDDTEGCVLSYEEPKLGNPKFMIKRDVYFHNMDFTMNIYNDQKIDVSFHYSATQSADEIKKAINKMIEDLMDMLKLSGVRVVGERKIVEFNGDGWDGGDPWCGHYGDTLACREEVEGEYKLTIG